jgi:hypothetical protein
MRGDTKELDAREPWRKLLDPIREYYTEGDASDLLILRRVVSDNQWFVLENEKLNRIVSAQAKVLSRHGLAGY